jgi:hypothetical protein
MAFFAYYIYIAIFAGQFVIPLTIWGEHYADFVRRYAAGASNPKVMIDFFCAYPIAIFILVMSITPRLIYAEEKYWVARWIVKSAAWRVGMIGGLAIIAVGAAFGMSIPGDPSFCNGCTTNSVLGLFAIYGIGLPIGFSLILAGMFCLARLVLKIDLQPICKKDLKL